LPSSSIYYFEVTVLNTGSKGLIAIGVSSKNMAQNKQVGQCEKSYGYKADGKVYSNKKAVNLFMTLVGKNWT
jgi:hypothetical protein